MTNEQKQETYRGTVVSNRRFGDGFWKIAMKLPGPATTAFSQAQPGQFVQLDLGNAPQPPEEMIPEDLKDSAMRSPLLRRPFSFSDIRIKNVETTVEILYCTVGSGSVRMTSLKAGDQVDVLGPLGNGFAIPENKSLCVLMVGGMGAGPMIHLAKDLTEKAANIDVKAFVGARSASALPFESKLDDISAGLGFPIGEFAQYGIETMVATDDGSAGFKGFVTECFTQWFDDNNIDPNSTVIYTCGPEDMMAATAKIAAEKNIECNVSLERRMGCGFGVCQSCIVECRGNGENERINKLCCKDGPVFNSREVLFD